MEAVPATRPARLRRVAGVVEHDAHGLEQDLDVVRRGATPYCPGYLCYLCYLNPRSRRNAGVWR